MTCLCIAVQLHIQYILLYVQFIVTVQITNPIILTVLLLYNLLIVTRVFYIILSVPFLKQEMVLQLTVMLAMINYHKRHQVVVQLLPRKKQSMGMWISTWHVQMLRYAGKFYLNLLIAILISTCICVLLLILLRMHNYRWNLCKDYAGDAFQVHSS